MIQKQLDDMRELYERLGSDAFKYTHYELAENIGRYTALEWKDFLTTPEIVDWIRSEQLIIAQSELQKIIANISDSKSVAKAQAITAIQKILEQNKTKEGAVFIYTYVPLDENQAQAPNVREETKDIFMGEITPAAPKFFKD